MYRTIQIIRFYGLLVILMFSPSIFTASRIVAGDCPPYQYAGSEMWGQAVDMIAENDTLFVLMTHGLLLIDVSNPDTMIRLGQYPLLESIPVQFERTKGIFYIQDETPQLQRSVKSFQLNAAGLLNKLDQIDFPDRINFIYASGDSLYVLQDSMMWVYSTTNPMNMTQAFLYEERGFAPFSMVKIDSLLVFANVQLLIHDARPGTFMARMSFLPPRNTHPFFLPYYNQLRICGPYLVATEQQNNITFSNGWVQLIDLADPLQPKRYSNYQIPRRIFDMSWGMNQIRVASDLGVHALSVVNDTQLQFLSYFPDPGGAGGIESDFNSAYTFTRDTMVTVSAPSNCRSCWCDSTSRDSIYTGDLLTLDYLPNGDVCVPSIYQLPGVATFGYTWSDYLYTFESTRSNTINIFDASLQDTLIAIAPFRFPHPVDQFGIDSNLLWIGANFRNLYLYRIEGPRNFVLIDSLASPFKFLAFSPSDSVLSFLTQTSGVDFQIRISAISGQRISQISSTEITDTLVSIAMQDRTIAIGRALVPALLIDATDISNPFILCSLSTPSYASGVANNQAILVAFQEGLGTSTAFYDFNQSACLGPVAVFPESDGHYYAHLGSDLYTYRRMENVEIWDVDSLPDFSYCTSLRTNGELKSITSRKGDVFFFESSGIQRYRRSPLTEVDIDILMDNTVQKSFTAVLSPNPTNSQIHAIIQLSASQSAVARVTIFDVLGRELADEDVFVKSAASWVWPKTKGGEPQSGVYFVRIQVGTETILKKAVMLK